MVENFNEKANFIWSVADLIRDTFKRGRYQDVILPFTVLRRIDQVLEPTKDQVLATYDQYRDKFDTLPDQLLRRASGYAFYNTSPYTFERLLADPANLSDNLRAYIAGFSPNMREVVEKFDFYGTLGRLDEAGLLYLVMERFKAIDLHPERVPNEEMGYIFEELIRKFNEALNENPGEHFTPREVIRLMVSLLIAPDREALSTPRISDGQLLFLQHMLARMKPPDQGGGRVAIVMNGSPLFTGDAGSGESEIRRHILDNDWLEAIVALPEQLFYNTGIATHVWVLSSRKAPHRQGKVQLIDATDLWVPMRRSLGDKRREIGPEQIATVGHVYQAFEDNERSKPFNTTHFGYRKIRVERPLRLNFQASPKRIARLRDERAFQNLAHSRKRDKAIKALEEAAGREQQKAVLAMLETLPDTLYTDRRQFEKALNAAVKRRGVKLTASLRKAILSALSERDETAEICRDKHGRPEPDPDLRDYERVPLGEDVDAYFAREVLPHVPDAWVDTGYTDDRDGGVGKVGYEINFNRYFYQYQPPRPLAEIEADIRALETEIVGMLSEVTR